MRSTWKGAISFGLVNIPVKLYPATEERQVKFHLLHQPCQTPIRYQRHCPTCDREVASGEIVRGYEFEKGRYVVVSDRELEELTPDTGHTIDIIDFVELSAIDPVYFARSYYLAPAEGGQKAYSLLERAMNMSGRVAIARFMLRTRESLAAVRARDGVLILATMFYPDEIRAREMIPELSFSANLSEKELEMAISLVESLTAPFEPEKYASEYRRALRELIQARIAGAEIAAPARPRPEKVVDLMEALRASLQQAEQRRQKEPAAGEPAGKAKVKKQRGKLAAK